MWRSIRWLDRCIEGHKRKKDQNLFPIVQGGLDVKLREISAKGKTIDTLIADCRHKVKLVILT